MLEFVIIVESEADFRTATGIAERIFKERGPDWLEDYLTEKFQWSGLESNEKFTCWKDIKYIIRRAGLESHKSPRPLGYARNSQRKADVALARKALVLAEYFQRERDIRAVIFIRDLDNQPERRDGLDQARDEFGVSQFQIVIGKANPNREAWVLNGFEAEDGEYDEITKIQDEIKFDPSIEPHRLRSSKADTPENRSRNAKVIFGATDAR